MSARCDTFGYERTINKPHQGVEIMELGWVLGDFGSLALIYAWTFIAMGVFMAGEKGVGWLMRKRRR
jgi:hypothetical protein